MFVDEINLQLKAGKGGDGVVRWRHEKGKEYAGPSGGNAGKGGDIYALTVRDIGLLAAYRAVKEFRAKAGSDGENGSRHGQDGADLAIKFPVGSIITNLNTRRRVELLREGEKVLLLSGGRGGLGNEYFKSSVNTRPFECTQGEKGEEAEFSVELQLIADAGLIGLPNAGKSSLLNTLTSAHAKIGSYAFTTLEPNLGAFFGFILADIPGLIEGASQGKGLGHKFLRHIRRTRILIHCLSLESENLADDYKTIRAELKAYDEALLDKPELIVLTKTDLADEKAVKKAEKLLKKTKRRIFAVSILDDKSIKNFSDKLAKILKSRA